MTEEQKPKKAKKNLYFRQEHQDAIIEFIKSDDPKEKNRLYASLIEPVLRELINKIVYTYKFNSLPNIDELKKDCAVHLVTILSNFDEEKGSKAFSYFSIVAKNWFIGENKKNSVRKQKEVSYESYNPAMNNDPAMNNHSVTKTFDEDLTVTNGYFENREHSEFWETLRTEMNSWLKSDIMKEQEVKVIKAIFVIINSLHDLGVYNKKTFYFSLREITGLNTKQIVNNLDKIRAKYKVWKKFHDNMDF